MSEQFHLPLVDSTGAMLTGKSKTDMTLLYTVDGVDTATTSITVAEVGSTGVYLITVPTAADGEIHILTIRSAGTLGTPSGWYSTYEWPDRIQNSELVTAVWAATTRTLSSFGSLTTDTATAVWAAGTRTLTSFGTLAADVWSSATRTLTSFGTLVADIISAGGTVSYDGPVAPTGDIEIVRGDTYQNADGRALEWSNTSWPTLTGGSILFTVRDKEDSAIIDGIAGTVVDADTARVELTAAQTTVTPGYWKFDLQATLASGSVVTLQRGNCRIHQEMTRA